MELFEKKVRSLTKNSGSNTLKLGPLIYGTAGFRMNYYENEERAHNVAILCTFVSCLRSLLERKWVGIMITASHNPICDNGIKIIDVTGNILNREYEKICYNVINSVDGNDPIEVLLSYYKEKLINDDKKTIDISNSRLILGYDTRPSSKLILEQIEKVIDIFGIRRYLFFGYVTTPQLHFMVGVANGIICSRIPESLKNKLQVNKLLKELEENRLTINHRNDDSELVSAFFDLYYSYHEYYFVKLNSQIKSVFLNNSNNLFSKINVFKSSEVLNNGLVNFNENGKLLLDVANGVGKYHFDEVKRILETDGIDMKMISGDCPDKLNECCGAEYVQKNILPPASYLSNRKCYYNFIDYVASFDGDADRLVYFASESGNYDKIRLIDGDRLSACYTLVITSLLNEITASLDKSQIKNERVPVLSLGVVQTAYANGASTSYIRNLLDNMDPHYFNVGIYCVPTGVKSLHRKAEEFDIGIYFEANGHGTVIHKFEFNNWIMQIKKYILKQSIEQVSCYIEFLRDFLNMFNPVIGDAISDLIAFEVARNFIQNKFGCRFALSLYDDLCVIQDKIKLEINQLNKLICDKDTEAFLIEPKELQDKINCHIKSFGDSRSRAFIRPSGTEQVARIYVEASTEKMASEIINYLKNIVNDYFLNNRTLGISK